MMSGLQLPLHQAPRHFSDGSGQGRDEPGDHGRGHLPGHPPSCVGKRLVEDDDRAAREGLKHRGGKPVASGRRSGNGY